MADENPQATSDDDSTKAETIRITLPSKGDALPAKRETVRINLPGRPAEIGGGAGTSAPKKETTKITADPMAAMPAAPSAPKPPGPPPPSAARPSAPPPPRPLSAGAPPKPPTLGARPTAPLKPAPPGAPAAPSAPTAPGAPKPPGALGVAKPPGTASPKKETARITLPPEGAKAAAGLPKATVKMQQTQPLQRQPSTIQASPMSAQMAPTMSPVSEGPDSGTTIMSVTAFVFALAALGLSFWAYSASGLQ